jgi:hypothetical protein
MTLPGFTGEASLYKTTGYYRLTTVWSKDQKTHFGLAQFARIIDGDNHGPGCIPGCGACIPNGDPRVSGPGHRICWSPNCDTRQQPCKYTYVPPPPPLAITYFSVWKPFGRSCQSLNDTGDYELHSGRNYIEAAWFIDGCENSNCSVRFTAEKEFILLGNTHSITVDDPVWPFCYWTDVEPFQFGLRATLTVTRGTESISAVRYLNAPG